ncbi:hypothetical protein D3C73_1092060 [compost metagenome]
MVQIFNRGAYKLVLAPTNQTKKKMPGWVRTSNGFPRTIHISVQPTRPEWTPTVRAVEPHKDWIVLPIAITQMIMPGHWIGHLTVEANLAEQAAAVWAIPIGCVGDIMRLVRLNGAQHRLLKIGCQQDRLVRHCSSSE